MTDFCLDYRQTRRGRSKTPSHDLYAPPAAPGPAAPYSMRMEQWLPWILAGLFSALSGAEGVYLWAGRRSSAPPPAPPPLVDDPLFARSVYTDGGLRACRQRLAGRLTGERRARFERSFDAWVREGLQVTEARAEPRDTPDVSVVAVTVPGLVGETLRAAVSGKRILLSYALRASGPKRRFQTVLPLPPEADGSALRLLREGDDIRLVFPRRHALPTREA